MNKKVTRKIENIVGEGWTISRFKILVNIAHFFL